MVFCDNCGYDLRSTAKFCGKCGTQIVTSDVGTTPSPNYGTADEIQNKRQNQSDLPEYNKGMFATSKPAGRIWYLLPLLGGLFGGIIAWAIIKNRNPKRARNILILGIVFGIIQYGLIGIVVIITLVSSAIDSPDEMSEIDSILSQYPEQIQKIKRSQLVDCEFNMAYLQSEAAGDIYKERCIDAILGR